MSMLFTKTINDARDAVDKIDAAVQAVQALADLEPQEFPNRPRIIGLRQISRVLAKQEQELQRLYQ